MNGNRSKAERERPADFPMNTAGSKISPDAERQMAGADGPSKPSYQPTSNKSVLDNLFADDDDEFADDPRQQSQNFSGVHIEGLGDLDEQKESEEEYEVPNKGMGEGQLVVVLATTVTHGRVIDGELALTRGRVVGISNVLSAWGKGDGNGGPEDLQLARQQMKRLLSVDAIRPATESEIEEARENLKNGKGSWIELASDSESPTVKLQRSRTIAAEQAARSLTNKLKSTSKMSGEGVPHGPSSDQGQEPAPPGTVTSPVANSEF